MIATLPGQLYKKYQDRFTQKKQAYLKEKGNNIKPVRLRDDKLLKNNKSDPGESDLNKSEQKLENLAERVGRPLLSITTIPYLAIFPTTITIDLKKITINDTTFIKTHSVQTISYDIIREISLETGLISSGLRIVLSGQFLHPLVFNHFRKKDAVMAKRLILGLMQCHKQQIKTDELDPETDKEKIIALGSAASP